MGLKDSETAQSTVSIRAKFALTRTHGHGCNGNRGARRRGARSLAVTDWSQKPNPRLRDYVSDDWRYMIAIRRSNISR